MTVFEGYMRFYNPDQMLDGDDQHPAFAINLNPGEIPSHAGEWADLYQADGDFNVLKADIDDDLRNKIEEYEEAGEELDAEAECDDIHYVRIRGDGSVLSWGPFTEPVAYARLDDEPEFELSVEQMFAAHGQEADLVALRARMAAAAEAGDDGPQLG